MSIFNYSGIGFSIIIPLYNKEKYIKKTISSILNQTYEKYEIIIINDGSTDRSKDVVESINDDRITLINIKNSGVSAARNYGIEHAKFEYIAFIDADDYWDKNYLKYIISLINKYKNASIFGTGYAEVYNNIYVENEIKGLKEQEQIIDFIDLFKKNYIPPFFTSSVVIKRELLEIYKFDTRISTGEDIMLWLRITSKNETAYCKIPLAFYNRDISDSLTRQLIPLEKNFIKYIHDEFNGDENLKELIDGLTARRLLPYYLLDINSDEVYCLLHKINFINLSLPYKVIYKLPKRLAKLLYILYKKIYKIH